MQGRHNKRGYVLIETYIPNENKPRTWIVIDFEVSFARKGKCLCDVHFKASFMAVFNSSTKNRFQIRFCSRSKFCNAFC